MTSLINYLAAIAITWLIAHLYYHRTQNVPPAWAKDFVSRLPVERPKLNELLKIVQEEVDSGNIEINHPLGRVSCPECGHNIKDFEVKVFGNDYVTIAEFTCPSCGWTEESEV